MRLATVRIDHPDGSGGTRAGIVSDGEIALLDAADVGEVLARGLDRLPPRTGQRVAFGEADLAPVVTRPDKIVCVGINYADHIAETGAQTPTAPVYFAKYTAALIGAFDPIALPDPEVSTHVDWEAELAVVIGSRLRHGSTDEALAAIGGYTVLNDVSVRDWQRRSSQFLAGKTFEGTTPVGPVVVTADELGDGSGLAISTEVDGVVKQSSSTSQLCFGTAQIVADLSRIITLEPGDIIATGTPGGVGAARTPPEWLADGCTVRCEVEGIGATVNVCRLPPV